ncbi:MAG: hypothetical protein J6038_01930, partial [Bacilli bacterium]|nr:hypothetical protein [Bacilli bacterium]
FSFLERKVSYPKLEKRPFALLEKNKIHLDPNKPIHTDRYMSNEKIGIFPQSDWEVDPNRVLSQLVVEETPLPLSGKLQAGESLAYGASASITGFLHARVQVEQTAEIYLHFDEINGGDDSHIEIDCFRNTTHNIVSYRLLPGEYELTSFLPYSAKYVRISCLSGSLEAKSFAIIALENPDVAISYSFEDERMQKIFDAACNTFRANAVDILTDCPSRERAGWLCDSFFSAQAEALLTGKNLVERNFLENYALYRPHGDVKKGMVPMCYPADFGEDMFIPNWAMFYGIELLSYSRRSGDSELVDLSKANLEGLLQYFEGFENEIGLLEDLENWVFIEWSEANNPESIAGVNLPSNMLYASFLEAVGELLGRHELLQKADSIRAKIREIGFDGTFFADNLIRGKDGKLHPSGCISETCQYYAFFFHTASFEQYPDLFALLRDEFGPSRDDEKQYPDVAPSNAFIGDYLRLAILLEAGYPEKVIEEAVAFFLPMAEQTGTLWEHSFAYGSLNHGFASYITVLLFKAITCEFGDYAYPYAYSFDLPREDGFLHLSSDGKAEKR